MLKNQQSSHTNTNALSRYDFPPQTPIDEVRLCWFDFRVVAGHHKRMSKGWVCVTLTYKSNACGLTYIGMSSMTHRRIEGNTSTTNLLASQLAETTKVIVSYVLQVPNQPLYFPVRKRPRVIVVKCCRKVEGEERVQKDMYYL